MFQFMIQKVRVCVAAVAVLFLFSTTLTFAQQKEKKVKDQAAQGAPVSAETAAATAKNEKEDKDEGDPLFKGMKYRSIGPFRGGRSLTAAGIPANCADFAAKVSSSEGNWNSVNPYGCLGAFQFCPGTFQQYYSGSAQSFLASPQAQTAAWTKYEQNSWGQAQSNGLTSLVGQQVCSGGQCATIDQSAILMACQFGCGKGGKLANYAASGNCNASNVKDGNGVSVCSYLIRGAGYDASCFTGQ